MSALIKFITISMLIAVTGCNSSKEVSASSEKKTERKSEMTKQNDSLLQTGYILATVRENKDSKCPLIIVDEKTKEAFDPINILDDKYKSFTGDNTRVYVKFRRLRMMNRCSMALPVEIEDMKSTEKE